MEPGRLCQLLCALLAAITLQPSFAQPAGHEVTGKLSPAVPSIAVFLYLSDGRSMQTHPAADGSFSFQDVPPGSHLLLPAHVNLMFGEARLDVTAKGGLQRATLVLQNQQGTQLQALPLPLQLRALGQLQHYEKRKPVDLWSFVKSPYGIMIVVSVFFIVVMPKLKVDPEELKQLQDELKGIKGSKTGGSAGAIAGSSATAGSGSGVQQRLTTGRS